MSHKEYWNSVAEKKEFTTPFNLDEFVQYVSEDAAILDLGCGYGRTLNDIYQHGFRNLVGIDFSEGMINRGKKQFPFLDLRVKCNKDIDFDDNSFDAVILFAVLTCISSDLEQLDLVKEIKRVLKPGGYLFINDFLLNNDERNLMRYAAYEKKYGYGTFELTEGAVLRHHHIDYIESLLISFTKCKMEEVTFKTMNGNQSNGFFYIGRKE
ncbi:class I SAM-dependent methyltransferase [Anaerocolumna sp. AGMB13025]|uniref:class I SAM-dependent methyltransferase n=1 Tax=Anaerocolumna sp. AGMB13025 TaxID=3039116 RepID=UPI00241BF390|nr:class I SAM-dependent methyltransferase [Anaerocolumna sp. AGMB13025]WFR56579.1 class I SAM-dependent methyltransferase [Anaerocolumna sp. AGMB13025]